MTLLVYLLCAFTSMACAVLLISHYFRTRSRLLFWSGWCFAFLAIGNTLLVLDWAVGPHYDLSPYRTGASFIGVALLLHGLIWETS